MHELNTLTEHFPQGYSPFPHQVEVLSKIEKSIREKHKVIVVQAPTGSGKSFISKTLANYTTECEPEYRRLVFNYHAYDPDYAGAISNLKKHGMFALTTTKALQNQYKDLFGDAAVFKGKSNYQCEVDDEFTVDLAPCLFSSNLKKQCWSDHVCPYYEARNDALIEKFSVLNYASFFNLPDHLKKRQIIVADECSELEDEIVKFYTTVIDYKKITNVGIELPKLTSEVNDKVLGWLVDVLSKIDESIANNMGSQYTKNKHELIKQQYRRDLSESVKCTINNWDKTEYIVEKSAEKVIITPLKIDQLSSCLFDFADTVILMSATIVNKDIFAKTFGITKFDFIDMESTFDPKKSPIMCSSKYPLSYKTIDANLPKVLDIVADIVKHHATDKGIIHTHSFAITEAVQKRLPGKRFLFREEGTSNEDIIQEHAMRKDPTVLVSPSLTMGLDLKGDLGKWQIIIKLPYPSLASKRIKRMFELDKEWYQMKMLMSLIQASGRCTRSAEDTSETYILDGLSGRLIVENKHILPKHFLDRLV